MIPLDEYKAQIQEAGQTLKTVTEALNPEAIQAELTELEAAMGAPDFWNDVENANKINQKSKALQSKLDKFKKLCAQYEDLNVLLEMAQEENDDSLADELKSETAAVCSHIEAMQLAQMLKGPYDNSNAVLSLHAGAGGTEAQDWTEMLYRMYTR